MWIASEKDGWQRIYHEQPIYDDILDEWSGPVAGVLGRAIPEVTFENSPQQIKIVLCKNQQ